jgi:hypothetical protein
MTYRFDSSSTRAHPVSLPCRLHVEATIPAPLVPTFAPLVPAVPHRDQQQSTWVTDLPARGERGRVILFSSTLIGSSPPSPPDSQSTPERQPPSRLLPQAQRPLPISGLRTALRFRAPILPPSPRPCWPRVTTANSTRRASPIRSRQPHPQRPYSR